MSTIFFLLFFGSLILLLIGLFSPVTSLFWDKKEKQTRTKSALLYGVLAIVFLKVSLSDTRFLDTTVILLLLLCSLILLVIGMFSPKTSLFWDKRNPTGAKSFIVYSVSSLFFFIIFTASIRTSGSYSDDNESIPSSSETSSTEQPQPNSAEIEKVENSTTTTSAATDQIDRKTWTEVFKAKGSGAKSTATFALTGNKARIKYKFTAGDVGLFYLYLVPEGTNIMKTGGIPEVSLQQSESDETYITKDAGKYYLTINSSGGNWLITVEEEK